ncbi:hypothetical protein POM88_029994 [Heracleum sosnowskyi]|uniref:Uncharacterized protein n=1 Tax=Heracleum sosnowskyi TaxID=360622 RepID=A0AAD8MHP8_9APIA|nr:hypothetical protein POM88_029994 [Heracleum sosnowskyi]
MLSSSELSEDLQVDTDLLLLLFFSKRVVIQANERFFRDGDPQSSSWERKRVSTEPAPSTEKVVKHPRVPRRKRQEAVANCDDIYDYYAGFRPNRKNKRGAIQSCKEAGIGSNVDRKEDPDDDDKKTLKERSMKSLLAGDIIA